MSAATSEWCAAAKCADVSVKKGYGGLWYPYSCIKCARYTLAYTRPRSSHYIVLSTIVCDRSGCGNHVVL